MVPFLGDYDTTETVNIPFNAFTSDDPTASATITNLVAGDVEIHKDGGVTQRASDAGVTVTIDFDTVTGNHMIHIDLSDNTDAGFYAEGSRYQVRIEGATVDAGTINAWIASFSVGCTLRPTTAGRTLDVSATGEAGLDFANINDATGAHTLTNITVPTVSTLTGHTAQTGDSFARLGAPAGASVSADVADVPTVAEFEARSILAASYFDPAVDTVANVTLVGTTTTNTDMVSEPPSAASISDAVWDEAQVDHVGVGSFGVVASEIADILTDTGTTLDTLIKDIPTVAEFEARSLVAANYFDPAADTVANVTTVGTTTTNTDMRGTDSAALASVCTESRLAELDAANIPADVDAVLVDTGTTLEGHLTDIKGATFNGATDSIEAIRNRGDAEWATATSVTVSDKTGFSLAADQSAATIGTVNTLTGHTAQTGDSFVLVEKIIIDQVYKKIIEEATGTTEQFNAAGVSLGTIATAYSSDGTYTTRKKMVI